MSVSVMLVLLVCMQAPGSRAVTVFVLKGSDVQLDIKEADVPEDFLFLLWKFNGTDNVVSFTPGGKPKVFSNYIGRVELVTKFSVKLKNVQETDSGVYAARVTVYVDQILSEYKVTVQAPVSPVTLTVDSVSSSSDSCNLTVTCRTLSSNISSTFTCVHQTCSEDGDRSENPTSGAVLHVYLENDSIKCNHSNQVSWTINQGATRIQDFCYQRSEVAGFSLCLVKTVVFSVGLIIMTSAVITVHLCETTKRRKPTQESPAVSSHPSHSEP